MSQTQTPTVKKSVRQGKFVSIKTLSTHKQELALSLNCSPCSGGCESGSCRMGL